MRYEEELEFIVDRVKKINPKTYLELLETYRREIEYMNSISKDSDLALREQIREWRAKGDALTDRGEELKEAYDLARVQLKTWYQRNLNRIFLIGLNPNKNKH